MGRAITKISLDEETADIFLYFGSDLRLDAFNHSMAYEGRHIGLAQDIGGLKVIALGGGELAIFDR